MLLAVDEIMGMARTMINVIGNGLASVVIAKWERLFATELEAPPPGRGASPLRSHAAPRVMGA
jgi:Na+/H+-dicarboxylate symporter